MCIIIDMDVMSRVFSKDNEEHAEFSPVREWIINGPGVIVCGGSTYSDQLNCARRFLPMFAELKKMRKVHVAKREDVDKKEHVVKQTLRHRDFDDQHIVAILLVTGCLLVCTADKRSHRFLSHKAFFPEVRRRPKFYGCRRDKGKLCNRNIPQTFRPLQLLNREDKRELSKRGLL